MTDRRRGLSLQMRFPRSISQPEGEAQQACISSDGKSRQNNHHIAAGPELLLIQTVLADLGEELGVALLPPK